MVRTEARTAVTVCSLDFLFLIYLFNKETSSDCTLWWPGINYLLDVCCDTSLCLFNFYCTPCSHAFVVFLMCF